MTSNKQAYAIVFLMIMGCGAPNMDAPAIVAQTVPASPRADTAANGNDDAADITNEPDRDPVEQLIERDAHIARDILVDALQSTEDDLASWAAVYIRLLKVDADDGVVTEKLLAGGKTDDLLLKALCYRWLVGQSALLSLDPQKTLDPVLQLFLALAQLSQSTSNSPDSVSRTLAVGKGVAFHEEKTSLNTLLLQTAPFDNGPIALSIAFINARRMSLATEVEGVTVPRSAGYRQQLLAFFSIHNVVALPEDAVTENAIEFESTSLPLQLQNPLAAQPVQMLRHIIVSAADPLKRDGLRALASTAVAPEVGDFAAAASAFQNPDAAIRVEAARTYLLLVSRATRN